MGSPKNSEGSNSGDRVFNPYLGDGDDRISDLYDGDSDYSDGAIDSDIDSYEEDTSSIPQQQPQADAAVVEDSPGSDEYETATGDEEIATEFVSPDTHPADSPDTHPASISLLTYSLTSLPPLIGVAAVVAQAASGF